MIRILYILILLIVVGFQSRAQAPSHIQEWNEVSVQSAVDFHSGDEYGFSVSVHDLYTAIGAPSHDFSFGATPQSNSLSADYREDAGSVYIFSKFGSFWRDAVKITAPDRQEFDLFGYSVSISGSVCAVGAPGEDHDQTGTGTSNTTQSGYASNSGAVYLYSFDGWNWSFLAKLTAPVREASDQFGTKVLLYGNRLIVSAPGEDHDANEANVLSNSGSVYSFVLQNGSWVLEQKIVASDRALGDEFGHSLDFDGTTLAVGVRFADISSNSNQGAVYTFTLGNTWSQQAKITNSDGASNNLFGASVAVFGTKLASGSPGNLGRGAAYTYNFVNGTWVNEQKLIASDIQSQDQFGECLSMYKDTLVVSAPGEDHDATGTSSSALSQGFLSNAGSAYVFYHAGSGWSQSQKLVPDSRAAQSNFSHSLNIYKDDMYIGSPYQAVNNIVQGIAVFYGKDVFVWTGATSSDPSVESNWKEGVLPAPDHDFLFTKGLYDPMYSNSLYANRITVLPSVELSINAPNVIRADGSFFNDGIVRLLGSNTGTYTSLFFRGSYTGAGTVFKEQYLTLGWHQLASPVLSNWSSIIGANSSALVGYDANVGNYAPQGTLLTGEGRGFFGQVTPSSAYGGSSFMPSAGFFSVQGIPKTQTTFQVGYANNSSPTNVQHSSALIDGWNLLGNPFTAPIDFRFLNRMDVDPYFSVWDPSLNGGLGGHKFWSYLGGALTYVIPPMQGFWVRAWSNSSTISPISMNGVGTIVQVPRFLKSSDDDFKLTLFSILDSSFTDAVWIKEVLGSKNDSFCHNIDVPKQFAPRGSVNLFFGVTPYAVSAKGAVFDRDTVAFNLNIERPSGVWALRGTGSRFDSHTWFLRTLNSTALMPIFEDVDVPLMVLDTAFELVGVLKTLGVQGAQKTALNIIISDRSIEVTFGEPGPFDISIITSSGQVLLHKIGAQDGFKVVLPTAGVYVLQSINSLTGLHEITRLLVH